MTNPPDLQQTVVEKGNYSKVSPPPLITFSMKYAIALNYIIMTTIGKINRAIVFDYK